MATMLEAAAAAAAAATTTTTIQQNVKPNNKDVVEETTKIIINSDEAKPAAVLASSQISNIEKSSTAAMSSLLSLSLLHDAKNASTLKNVSSPPEHVLPKVKGKKSCFIPFAYLVARKCSQPPPIFDLKALTDCMMQ
jgi:hypothetical protein